MQGVECTLPVGKVSAEALNQGLIVITAGSNVLRFVPPLEMCIRDRFLIFSEYDVTIGQL